MMIKKIGENIEEKNKINKNVIFSFINLIFNFKSIKDENRVISIIGKNL